MPAVILVAGEALVDLIVRADGGIVAALGGSCDNTARAIGRLGTPVGFAGTLSDDAFGRRLETGLVADGVSLDLVQRTSLPTTLALAELDGQGIAVYRFYVDGTSAPAMDRDRLAVGAQPDLRALHVGSLGLVLEPMATAIEALVAALPADVPLMVDPNCRPSLIRDPGAYHARLARILARADVVKLSAEDLAFLHPGATVDEGIAWVEGLGPRTVFVTDGARPAVVRAAGETHRVPAPPVVVVDTVGAGDTFGGALLGCLVEAGTNLRGGTTVEDALRAARFAVRASAMVCGRAGADPPTLAELGGWPAR
jgi:fructokinase